MEHLKYESRNAHVDIWIWPAVTDNEYAYYECILLYVDDVLVVSEHPKDFLIKLSKYFQLKPYLIGPSYKSFGGTVSKVNLPNDVDAWVFSLSQYVQETV